MIPRLLLRSETFTVTLKSGELLSNRLYTWITMNLESGQFYCWVGDTVVRKVDILLVNKFEISGVPLTGSS